MRRFVGLTLLVLVFATPVLVHAEPAPSAASTGSELGTLLLKLGKHGERIEEMKRRGSYTLSGHLERLDGDGGVQNWKDLVMHVVGTGDPSKPKNEVVKYVEDGEDKTAEAKQRAAERAKKKPDPKREFRVPFLPSEQSKYDFRLLGRDERFPGRVKIGFQSRVPSEDTWNGTAWVHEADGEIESMGFTFSEKPSFVDEAVATLVFGNQTELGRAPSKLTFEGKGGFLFIRRHYRGTANLTEAKLNPKTTR